VGLVSGITGLVLGTAAVATDQVTLGVLAGACALLAGIMAYRVLSMVGDRSEAVEELERRLAALEADRARAEQGVGAWHSTEASHRSQGGDQQEPDGPTAGAGKPDDRHPDVEVDTGELAAHLPPGDGPAGADLLTDTVTGLFSEAYFHVALDARVTAARRQLRPVSVALVEVVEPAGTAREPAGEAGRRRAADPCQVSAAIAGTLRDADTACRMDDGAYALLLEDTPEDGALWTVERLRRRLTQEHPDRIVRAGIACYPAHGLQPDEVLARAVDALESARDWPQDRIEIAGVD
jgi:GGDEF domain-containing protein